MVVCLLAAAALLLPGIRSSLENRLYAALLASAGRFITPTTTPITIVAIDEASIDALGPWPWPRATWAELLDRLRVNHRPTVIALDVVFPPDPRQHDGNAEFARSLSTQLSVIGQLLITEPGVRGRPTWSIVTTLDTDGDAPDLLDVESFPHGRLPGILASESVLVSAPSVDVGHINAQIDADGIMRHAPTVLCADITSETCTVSFVQAAIQQLTGARYWQIRPGRWSEARWVLIPGDLTPLAIPVDDNLRAIIPWRHPSGLRHVSAADIWHNRLTPGLLDQDILLFGGVSIGLGDIATTPLGRTVPGVEVHGQLLRSWLQGSLPFVPRYAVPLAWAYIALLTLLFVCTANRWRTLLALTVAGSILPLAWAVSAWVSQHALVPAAGPAAFALLAGSLLVVRCLLNQHRNMARRAISYLPPPLRRLLETPNGDVPSETGWGTIMVADILGYTRQSHRLSLDELAQWSELGMEHVVRHATARGAMLDNVAGDGALLIWREGTKQQQARAALDCVRTILATLPNLNKRLEQMGLPPLAIGFGLHAGDYLLASLGTGQKRYTVVSEAANLAAHIERQTRRHPWPVLLSETLARLSPASTTRQVAYLSSSGGEALALYTLADEPDNRWPVAPTVSTATTI